MRRGMVRSILLTLLTGGFLLTAGCSWDVGPLSVPEPPPDETPPPGEDDDGDDEDDEGDGEFGFALRGSGGSGAFVVHFL